MYDADIQTHAHPKLSQMIDLAGIGDSGVRTHAQLDSMYAYEHHKEDQRVPKGRLVWDWSYRQPP